MVKANGKVDSGKATTNNLQSEKLQAIKVAMEQIDKQCGAGSIMKLGTSTHMNIESVPTSAMALDLALGIGGFPRGRITEIYFPGEVNKAAYRQPFTLTEMVSKMSASAVVTGGGPSSQLGAVVHGLARTLASFDRENFRHILKAAGLLTRDSRKRQRRMIGMGGKSRRKRQSPKR